MSFWHSYSWAISASRSYDISVDRSTFSILTHGVDEHAFVLPLSLASREMRVVQDVGASYWVMIPLQLCTILAFKKWFHPLGFGFNANLFIVHLFLDNMNHFFPGSQRSTRSIFFSPSSRDWVKTKCYSWLPSSLYSKRVMAMKFSLNFFLFSSLKKSSSIAVTLE
ncbi:hypothetical protein V6N11_058785 [Hibiscus sabdariffa]|uniref:Uncharacterized protein n=1 Tax=Hibiscus sabdariffa TaxID=183260 RepID=A0ABR2U5F8_9ROSI